MNAYNEPWLNLHFLGPWFKDCQSSLGSLELIFELLWVLSPDSKSALLEFLHTELKGMQKALFMNTGDDHGQLRRIMPFFHILILIFTNYRDFALSASKELLVDIAMISHEIRLMPLPYG